MTVAQEHWATGSRLLVCLALLAMVVPAYADPVFTGDVEADFTEPGTWAIVDDGGVDVGVPPQAPQGAISGNDIKDIRFLYNNATDVLYVGLNTYGIAGDVDGDGDPGATSLWLADLNGTDFLDFGGPSSGGGEAFAVMFDIDEDGTFDVIAGVSDSTDISGYSVNWFSGDPFAPGCAFGDPLPSHTGMFFGSPSAAAPDLEFTIRDFSKLPTCGADTAPTVGVRAYIGSFADDGIGEDSVPGSHGTLFTPEPFSMVFTGGVFVGVVVYRLRKRKRDVGKR